MASLKGLQATPNEELEQLRKRLADAEDILRAIHLGEVDGVVVEGAAGPQVFTLQTPDQPYRALVECMSQGAASISDKGIILFCNQGLADMVGRPPQKLLGSSADLLVRPSDRERLHQLLAAAFVAEGETEIQLDHIDGSAVPVKVSLKEIAAAQVRSIAFVATDLSGIRQAEETIRRQASLVDLAHDAMIFRQFDGRIVSWNRGAKDLYGWSAEEAIGKTCQELLKTKFPISMDTFYAMIRRAQEWEGELVQASRDGVWITVASRWSVLRDKEGEPVAILEVNRDITERKRAEEALSQSQERLQLQIQRMPLACIVWDRNFRVTSWNPAAEQIFGFKQEEALGRHPYEFIVPKSAQGPIDQVFQRLLEGDATAHSTNENLTADGRVITCHWTNTPVKGADGQTVAVLSMAEDITERMQTETRIKLERQRFESVLDGLPVMVCLLTPNYDVAFANHAFRKQFGESQGRKCYEYCYGKSSPCDFCQSFQVLKTGAPHDWEVTKEDGRIIHAFDVPFADVDGSPLVLEMDIDITQQRQAEQKLREASHYTRSLIEASLDPLVTISRDGKITDVNEATEKATGIPRDQLIGSDFAEYFTDSDKARQGYERVFIEGTVRDYPLAIRHTSGRLTDVLYNASLFHNQKGEVEGVFAAARDVTERKRAEEAVRKLNEELEQRVQERTVELERTRNILAEGQRIAHLGTFEYIAETKTTIWSEEEYRIYGLDPAGPSPDYATLMTSGFHPEDVAKLDQTFKAAMEKRSIYELEHRIVHPDGSVRWVYDLAYPYFDNGGKLVRYIGATLDITERKQAEAALRDKEELLRAVTDNSPDAIYVKDGSSRWLMANPAVLRIVGRTAEQALGKTDLELYADAAVGRAILENDRRTMEAGRTEEFEEVADTPDGRRTFLSVKAPRRDAHGNIVGLIGISHDITARKLVEEGVRESELRFRTLANTVPDLVWTCTPDGKCDFFSSRWIEYTGIPAEDQLGYAWLNQVHPDDRERLLSEWRQSLENDHPFDIEFRIRNHRGLYRWFKTRAVALRDQGGRVLKWFGTNTDIEDLRRSQQELTAANKELESFNYAVAHDLRAPLRHIHGFADLLAQDAAPVLNEASQKHLQIIRESVERMGQLLQELLNLSRLGRQELHKKSCDLNVLIQQVLAELKPEAANREIEWRVGDLPAVECDASLVKQVLLNLVSNAVKFTRKRRPAIIEIGQSMQNGVPAVFVRDNGEGFDMKYADKLFGIFQRLHRKEDFEGTGVGLAIVQRIVHRHGGSIWAEAELNRGATFYFSLQSCERERQNHRAAAEVA